jgi:adenosyl cobinamide kinase/adenosyl cobinamide phosphate guanylyltransferase
VSLTFLLGGARSGKSSLAVELAREWQRPVTVIATAEPRDDDMAERIRVHRDERPDDWTTVEEPLELERAVTAVSEEDGLVVDCLTLWVANLLDRGRAEAEVEEASRTAAARTSSRSGPTVVISNEVGLGVVPATELGRRYRDLLGRVNTQWAAVAESAAFVVAGRRLPLS